jgi:uncharacterized membrane protein required for colicin V production
MITIPESGYLFVDIAVAVLYIWAIAAGGKKGFLPQLLSTLGTVLSFYLAWRYCGIGASYFQLWPQAWNPAAGTLLEKQVYVLFNRVFWFFLLLVILRLLFSLLSSLFSQIKRLPVLHQISVLLGGLLGAVNATIWVLVFAVLLNTPLFNQGSAVYEGTVVHTINETVSSLFQQASLPALDLNEFNKLYEELKDTDGQDTQAIEQWLQEHGYTPEE